MMYERILLVEDDKDDTARNCRILEKEGYAVLMAGTLAQARALTHSEEFDLAVLDLVMPEGSCLDFCGELRGRSSIPILLLAARDERHQMVDGLRLGANDYITKPYEPEEFATRIRVQLDYKERMCRDIRDSAVFQGLMLDLASSRAVYKNRDISLTPTEFSLLESMIRRPGQYIGACELYHMVWGINVYEDITLFAHVSALHRKLDNAGAGHIRIDRHRNWGLRLLNLEEREENSGKRDRP